MPIYYLHIRDADELIEDPDGSDLPDLNAAHAEALAGVREILANCLRAGRELDGQRIEITDEAGEVLAIVPFEAAIRSEAIRTGSR